MAVGMSSILSHIPGMKSLMPYWYNFALMFEALFILTTVDAGTRVARFLIQELGGRVYKPLARQRWVPGIVIASLAVVVAWGYLIYSGSVSSIWPMFGVSNQLLAAIALGVGTTLIIKDGKLKYAWVTFVPMAFMFTTTFVAAWQLMNIFRVSATKAATPLALHTASGPSRSRTAGLLLVLLMAVLAFVSLADMLYKWYGFISKTREITSSEVVEYSAT